MNPLRGLKGHPSHPPLTDVAIGGFTAATVLLVLGYAGVAEEAMAKGAWPVLWIGLVGSMAAGLTGLLDWFKLERGSQARRVATTHMLVMLAAVGLFIGAEVTAKPGFDDGEVRTVSLVLALAGLAVLTVGGWLGGKLVFVHGIRVEQADDVAAPPR